MTKQKINKAIAMVEEIALNDPSKLEDLNEALKKFEREQRTREFVELVLQLNEKQRRCLYVMAKELKALNNGKPNPLQSN